MAVQRLVVRKDRLAEAELRAQTEPPPLPEGQVRVAIESFALTSNNITYAAFGEAMNYWRFFPVTGADGSEDAAWGCIPVWGFGTVVESRHPAVSVGERLYGYFPMASQVDLQPVRVDGRGFADGTPHRVELHPVYNQYLRCAADPFHAAGGEALQSLLRPLYTTSWLIDDFLADNAYFGAADGGRTPLLLLSSASSKTAFGTAFEMARRGGTTVVGFTSPRNVGFCESLGCYARVLTYDELDRIPADAPAVYVDFAGHAGFRRALHTRLAGLVHSSSIGGTHVAELGGAGDLPGPRPTLFFAPAQIRKRSGEWGAAGFAERLLASWRRFVATVGDPARPWLRVQAHHGADGVGSAYRTVLAGDGDPRIGHVAGFGAGSGAAG